MRKLNLFVIALALSSCVVSHADEIRVYKEYSPARVQYVIGQHDGDLAANKAGNKGGFKVVEQDTIPKDREDRDSWKFEKDKFKIDPGLKAEQDAKKNKVAKLADKLKAMGLDDEDLKLLSVRSE